MYQETFPNGSKITVVSRDALEAFLRDWKFHNKLEINQLIYADQHGTVESVGFYHGGDRLYQLKEIPGIWHECCLKPGI